MSDISALLFARGRNSVSSGAATMSQRTSASVSVEDLPQLIGPDQHAAVFWHGQRFVPYAHAAHAFQHEIKLLRADVFVQRVRALGWEPPKPRSEVFALG